MDSVIYTLVRRDEWHAAEAEGVYRGSPDDRRDGFLHFSAAAQLRATAAKHRAGVAGLLLVVVPTAPLGAALRWEAADGGARQGLFPHLYASLPITAVQRVVPLPLGADGLHIFPVEIP
jgi:uncharacterized protein (DUF952 family)